MKTIELTYHEGPDGMIYPDLKPSPQTHYHIGKYGNLHLAADAVPAERISA